MTSRPATRIIAKGIQMKGRYAGQFALPGLAPEYVKANGKPELFGTEREAEIAAMDAVIGLYDSRTYDERKASGYRRMTGSELALAIEEINTTPTYFAELVGVPQSRVMKWLDGEQDIPHSVHVLAKLLRSSDENFKLAEQLTEGMRDHDD